MRPLLASVAVVAFLANAGDAANESIPRDGVLWQFDTGG